MLVGQGFGVQDSSARLPMGQVPVHDRDKLVAVVTLQKVRQFMDDDVFETLRGLFRQFKIQPDALRFDVAGAPLCLHFLDAPISDGNSHDPLPFRDERGNQLLDLAATERRQIKNTNS